MRALTIMIIIIIKFKGGGGAILSPQKNEKKKIKYLKRAILCNQVPFSISERASSLQKSTTSSSVT